MNRRSVLLLGLGWLTACTADSPQRTLRVAAGEPGGFYVEFATLLARRLTPALGATAVKTGGSADNLSLVTAGRAELGLTLADLAAAAVHGREPFTEPMNLRAIGRVYENYMQLVVPQDSPVWTVADLAGRRISLGANGSGAAVFGDRLLAAAGVEAAIEHRTLESATAGLAAGDLAALLWSGGVPTPALRDLARPIRLIKLTDQLAALRAKHGPVYHEVVVPAGTYGTRHPVATVGVSNLLVCARSLPDDVAGEVARTLVADAQHLIPRSALGTQYLDFRSLIETGEVPLHPGAATAYRELRR